MKHNATASKDRTSIFMDKPEFKISAETGKTILKWCNEGLSPAEEKQRITQGINDCKSLTELFDIYNLNPQFQESLKNLFKKKRTEVEQLANTLKPSENGTH